MKTFNTHSLTNKNLSPSLAIHLPRLLKNEPWISMVCGTPDWNHEPSHRLGNKQPDEPEIIGRKDFVSFLLDFSWVVSTYDITKK